MDTINGIYGRSSLLLGDEAMKRMSTVRVIIFGIGGVGSWAAEALVRTGITHLTIVDFDRVATTNINRQLPATTATVGELKTQIMKRRLLEINPDAEITSVIGRYAPETSDSFDLDSYDYVIDAIDSLRDKASLILNATRSKARLFSSMGAALKTDPSKIAVTEFWKVNGCRLAAALRQRFKRSGEFPARKFKVVYSPELVPNKGCGNLTDTNFNINGSLVQITGIFGLTLASLVINDIARCDISR